jgi:hypothetical protein
MVTSGLIPRSAGQDPAQASGERIQLLVAVRLHLSISSMRYLSTDSDLERRSALPKNSTARECLAGGRTPPQDGILMSYRSSLGAAARPLKCGLGAWTTVLQSCLNVLGAYSWCDRRATSLTAFYCFDAIPCWSQCGWAGNTWRICWAFLHHWLPMILAGVVATSNCAVTS